MLSQNGDIEWYYKFILLHESQIGGCKNAFNTHILCKVELVFLLVIAMTKAYRTESNPLRFTSTLVSTEYGNVYGKGLMVCTYRHL